MEAINPVFERHNPLLNFFRIPIVLLLNTLPKEWCKKIFLMGSRENGDARVSAREATTYKPLEVMYTFRQRERSGQINLSDWFWENFLSNARSIRNRFILSKALLKNAIEEERRQGKEVVNILSLASGSARAVIEVIAELSDNQSVRLKMVDLSRNALDHSKRLAKAYGLDGQISWCRGSVFNFEKFCGKDFEPDIVEMVGLLDYLNDSQAVELISAINDRLNPGGWLITANIVPNIEKPFVTKGIGWPMIYRSEGLLKDLMVRSGFVDSEIKVEPLGIHALSVSRKEIAKTLGRY